MATIDGLPPLREVIRAHDLVAKKQLGQNFLLDLNLTAKIARQAGDLSGCDVLEIGPGPGGLTRGLLAEGARRVLAVEKDPRCMAPLASSARVGASARERAISTPSAPGPRSSFSIRTKARIACGSAKTRSATFSASVSSRFSRSSASSAAIASVIRS